MISFADISHAYRSSGQAVRALSGVSLDGARGRTSCGARRERVGQVDARPARRTVCCCRTTGAVTVDGIDTRDRARTRELRQRVGMVFQRPDDQIVATSVEDDVAFGPENLGLAEGTRSGSVSTRRWLLSAWRGSSAGNRTCSRAARSSDSRSPELSRCVPPTSCSTSPRRCSTPRVGPRCSAFSMRCGRQGPASCTSPTISPTCSALTARSCSIGALCVSTARCPTCLRRRTCSTSAVSKCPRSRGSPQRCARTARRCRRPCVRAEDLVEAAWR